MFGVVCSCIDPHLFADASRYEVVVSPAVGTAVVARLILTFKQVILTAIALAFCARSYAYFYTRELCRLMAERSTSHSNFQLLSRSAKELRGNAAKLMRYFISHYTYNSVFGGL